MSLHDSKDFVAVKISMGGCDSTGLSLQLDAKTLFICGPETAHGDKPLPWLTPPQSPAARTSATATEVTVMKTTAHQTD